MRPHPFLSCTQISTVFSSDLRNLCNLRTIFQVVFYFNLYLLIGFHSVFAQTLTPQVSVTIKVLDADGKPVTGIRVELIIFQYALSVEPMPAGGCKTNATGSCLISTNLPPSSGPDRYEGVVYVSDLGRQLVGWQGNEPVIVVQLTSEGIVPTDEPHLHGPYTGEQYAPTEGSPDLSPTPTTVISTKAPLPTETLAVTSPLPSTPNPTSSPSALNSAISPLIIICLIVGLCVMGAVLWRLHTYRIRRHG